MRVVMVAASRTTCVQDGMRWMVSMCRRDGKRRARGTARARARERAMVL